MSTLLLVLLILLNLGVSFWNAYKSGAILTECKFVGWRMQLVTYCGLMMSVCGFTWVYATLVAKAGAGLGIMHKDHCEAVCSLGRLVIIMPTLGCGLSIWAHSMARAYRVQNFGNVALASWNTVARARNAWVARYQGPTLTHNLLANLTRNRGAGIGVSQCACGIVLLAICSGFITAIIIARWADKKIAVDYAGIDML